MSIQSYDEWNKTLQLWRTFVRPVVGPRAHVHANVVWDVARVCSEGTARRDLRTYAFIHNDEKKKESKDDEELEYEFITEKVRVNYTVIHFSIQLNSLSACVTSSPPSLHYSSRKRCRNRDT